MTEWIDECTHIYIYTYKHTVCKTLDVCSKPWGSAITSRRQASLSQGAVNSRGQASSPPSGKRGRLSVPAKPPPWGAGGGQLQGPSLPPWDEDRRSVPRAKGTTYPLRGYDVPPEGGTYVVYPLRGVRRTPAALSPPSKYTESVTRIQLQKVSGGV